MTRVVTVADPYVKSGTPAAAMCTDDLFTCAIETDAHFTAYEPTTEPPTRLKSDSTPRPSMVLLVADLDAPGHARTPESDADMRAKAAHLPGEPFGYFTRGGARLVWTIDPHPVVAEEWSRFYLLALVAIAAASGLVADPACSDWTRLFRAPHATRDGVLQAHGWLCGHPTRIGHWSSPMMNEGEILAAVGWLATQQPVWVARAKKLAPAPVVAPPPVLQVGKGYANAALARACVAVRRAPEGQRHAVLAAEAWSIGGLVGANRLERSDAIRQFTIAVSGWANQSKTLATIAYQLDQGAAHPRAS